MTFDDWWANTGSALHLLPGEDPHEHAHRVAREAWTAAICASPLPPGELRYRRLQDGTIKDCLTGEQIFSEKEWRDG